MTCPRPPRSYPLLHMYQLYSFCWVYVQKQGVCVSLCVRRLCMHSTMTKVYNYCQYVVSHLRCLFAYYTLDRYEHAQSRRRQSLAFVQYGRLTAPYTRRNRHRRRQMARQGLWTVLWGHGMEGRSCADGSGGRTTTKNHKNQRLGTK